VEDHLARADRAATLVGGTLDAAMRASIFDCVLGVVVTLVAIPWGYVLRMYVRRPGDPWRRPVAEQGP
jgi:hypothetical protein